MQGLEAIGTTGLSGAGANSLRTRAHARARNHSTRVRRLRVLIPAAALLSLAGLAAYTLNPFGHIAPGVTVGPVSLSGTKVRMESPRLSGFRKGTRGYEVTAEAALQDVRKPTLIELQSMKGRVDTDDKGGLAHLEAATGLFDTAKEALTLERDIRLWTDKGEEMRLKSAAVDFKTGGISSRESVTVTVPSGSVAADSLDVVENGRVISFIGNVRAEFHTSGSKADATRIRTTEAVPAAEAKP